MMQSNKRSKVQFGAVAAIFATLTFTTSAFAVSPFNCSQLPNLTDLSTALSGVVAAGGNGGLALDMWATVVDRDGVVCAVAKSGVAGNQWPGSRVISAQKANTANAFSLPGLALSTANLYSAVQPGGSLYGLQHSNPVDTAVAYAGDAGTWGTSTDDLVTNKVGGVNVFGGGLPLYNSSGVLVGGLGVSGSTSCTDHIIAWKIRSSLNYDDVPAGVAPDGTDNIIFDIVGSNGNFKSKGGFGHPECGFGETPIAKALPTTLPVGP